MSILPDPAFSDLKGALAERLGHVAVSIQPDNFGSLLDPLMREVLRQGFADATAHEGTIWLLDAAGGHLVPAYNTGPNAVKFVGAFRQPLHSGIVCMVFESEQPFVENEVYKNARRSKQLDELLQVQTGALIAVPFYLLNACRGVISCVQLKAVGVTAPDPAGFTPKHLAAVERTAVLLSRLLDFHLLSRTVGWAAD